MTEGQASPATSTLLQTMIARINKGDDVWEIIDTVGVILLSMNKTLLPIHKGSANREQPADILQFVIDQAAILRRKLQPDVSMPSDLPTVDLSAVSSLAPSLHEDKSVAVQPWGEVVSALCTTTIRSMNQLPIGVSAAHMLFLLACQEAGFEHFRPREANFIEGYLKPLIAEGLLKPQKFLEVSGENNKIFNSLLASHPEAVSRILVPGVGRGVRAEEYAYGLRTSGVEKFSRLLLPATLTPSQIEQLRVAARSTAVVPGNYDPILQQPADNTPTS